MREKLAALCHEQWTGWMEYMFGKGKHNDDGTWTMPQWAVERWTRQVETPYAELPTEEQNSDRAEADRFIALLTGYQKEHGNIDVVLDTGVSFDTIDGRYHRFQDGKPTRPLEDLEVAYIVWAVGPDHIWDTMMRA